MVLFFGSSEFNVNSSLCALLPVLLISFKIFLIFSSFLSLDIFTSVFSSGARNSVRVDQLSENLKSTVLASKASGISENYLRAFKWKAFASDVFGILAFPVRPLDCALFLQHLLESSKSAATINSTLYAFRWIHLLAGVV